MNSKAILTTTLSIIIGAYPIAHLILFSGINPFMNMILQGIMIVVLVYNLVLIFRRTTKKFKVVQSLILIFAVVIGFYLTKVTIDSLTKENSIKKYQNDTQIYD